MVLLSEICQQQSLRNTNKSVHPQPLILGLEVGSLSSGPHVAPGSVSTLHSRPSHCFTEEVSCTSPISFLSSLLIHAKPAYSVQTSTPLRIDYYYAHPTVPSTYMKTKININKWREQS